MLQFVSTQSLVWTLHVPAGDTLHLLHVVPEPSMVHVWPGMYVPPDDDAEQDEVTFITGTSRQDIHTDSSTDWRVMLCHDACFKSFAMPLRSTMLSG